VDDGSEFSGREFDQRENRCSGIVEPKPTGKPTGDCVIETLNSPFRDESLKVHLFDTLFDTLDEAKSNIEACKKAHTQEATALDFQRVGTV